MNDAATSQPGPPAELRGQRRSPEIDPPSGSPVGYQRWSELLFLHWRVDVAAVQASLPPGLRVDLYQGNAHLGIVPFFMERIRPAWLPPVPGISWFHELNVRTYVIDERGRPGVWFYSLDCDQPLAVKVARYFFHLPYFNARIRSSRTSGEICYEARRRDESVSDRFVWQRTGEGTPAEPDSLDFFLIERYRLFSSDRNGRLHSGRVVHPPYRVTQPVVSEWSSEVAQLAGFALHGPPVTAHAAERVDVAIHTLEPCR